MINPDVSNPPKNRFLLVVKILCWIQYGGTFLCCFFGPIISHKIWGTQIGAAMYYILVVVSMLFATFAGIGLGAMRYALRSIENQIVVQIWSLLAIILAPFTATSYVYLSNNLPLQNEDVAFLCNILSPFIGFYLPLVLPIFWIKYRYRDDEF